MTLEKRVEQFIKMNSHHCHGPSAMQLFRDVLAEMRREPHPLKPRGDAERHRLVAARLNLRSEA